MPFTNWDDALDAQGTVSSDTAGVLGPLFSDLAFQDSTATIAESRTDRGVVVAVPSPGFTNPALERNLVDAWLNPGDPVPNWTGPFDALRAYVTNDAVVYQNHNYVALQNSTGVTPGTAPATWQLLTLGFPAVATVEAEGSVPENDYNNPGPKATQWLVARGFSFSLPANARVRGIGFAFKYQQTSGATDGNGPVIYDFGILQSDVLFTLCAMAKWDVQNFDLPGCSSGFSAGWPFDAFNFDPDLAISTFHNTLKFAATPTLNTDFYMSSVRDLFGMFTTMNDGVGSPPDPYRYGDASTGSGVNPHYDIYEGGPPNGNQAWGTPNPVNGSPNGPWWTPAQVNAPDFGCAFCFASYSGGAIRVAEVRMRVYYDFPPTVSVGMSA